MKKILFVLSFFLLIYTPYVVEAKDEYNIIEEIDSPDGFDVGESVEGIMSGNVPVSFLGIVEKTAELFIGGIKKNLPSIVRMIVLAILSGLIINLNKEESNLGTYAAVAIVSILSVRIFSYTVSIAEETIDSLFIFISSLMMPLATVSSVGAAAKGSAAGIIFVAMQVFIHICKSLILPLICVITVFSVTDKVGQRPFLFGITNILKTVLKWGTGFMIMIYTVVVGLQTQAAATLDNLAGKSIKYAVGTFVPVVGGALSDTLETVIASAKTMSGALGISGVLGVLYICAVPLVNICSISLSFKLASAIISVTSEKKISSVVEEFAQSISRVSVVLLSVSVMFIISLSMITTFGGK